MDVNISEVYQSIMDTAVDGILVINNSGIMLKVNKAVSELFLFSEEELIGHNVSMLMTDIDKYAHDGYINNYVQTRKPKIIGIGRDIFGRRKDGTVFDLRLAVSEVVVNGQMLFTGILHDITPLKNTERKLLGLNQELDTKVAQRTFEVERVVNQLLAVNKTLNNEIEERKIIENELLNVQSQIQAALSKERELNEMKENFITTVSHEYRTPLASILSSASLIAQYSSEDDLSKRLTHVEKIKKAANNLTALLTDILTISKIDENKISLSVETVNISQLANEIISELSPIFKAGQTILLDNQGFDQASINTDSKLVKNIIFNLTSNALKYSSDEVKISIGQSIDNKLMISIHDKGIGIPLKDQSKLLGRFYRASNVGQIQGTGLGLHIVKKYCDLLKATLTIESEENSFTSVKITFN